LIADRSSVAFLATFCISIAAPMPRTTIQPIVSTSRVMSTPMVHPIHRGRTGRRPSLTSAFKHEARSRAGTASSRRAPSLPRFAERRGYAGRMGAQLRVVLDQAATVVHPDQADAAIGLARGLVATAPSGCSVEAIVPAGAEVELP